MRRHAILAQRAVAEGTGSYGEKKTAGGARKRCGGGSNPVAASLLRLRCEPRSFLLFARSRPHQPGNSSGNQECFGAHDTRVAWVMPADTLPDRNRPPWTPMFPLEPPPTPTPWATQGWEGVSSPTSNQDDRKHPWGSHGTEIAGGRFKA